MGSNGNSAKKDDDFFESWDKPASTAAEVTSAGTAAKSLGSGLVSSATSNSNSPIAPRSPAPAQPRTVQSSSLRTANSSGAGGATGKTKTGLGASKLGGTGKVKLGAKKAGASINFEEAERKAKEEEERVKKLGYDSIAEQSAAALDSRPTHSITPNAAVSNQSTAKSVTPSAKSGVEDERLGMGMRKLGFGQTFGMSGEESASLAEKQKRAAARAASGYVEEAPGTVARERFGNQKGGSFQP